jgi:YVTN family beta-propeller protein
MNAVRPKDLAVSPDGTQIAVLSTGRIAIFTSEGAVVAEVAHTAGPLGLAWSPDGHHLYASNGDGKVSHLSDQGGWNVTGVLDPVPAGAPASPVSRRSSGNPQTAGLAISANGKTLYAALGIRNSVSVIDLATGKAERLIPVGIAPYSLLLDPTGKRLITGNRGGESPVSGKPAAPSAGTPVAVDDDTDGAAAGSLSIVDVNAGTITPIPIGKHPAGMAATRDGSTLYTAIEGEDAVAVIDLPAGKLTRTLTVRPPGDPGFGQIPTSCALSGDEKTLYVACGGANAVAVVSLSDSPRARGYIPSGWFPIAVATMGDSLAVACAKGVGSRLARSPGQFAVHSSVGTVQLLRPSDLSGLERLTREVAANNQWGQEARPRRDAAPMPIPERVGEPSVFKHVVYVIKENHTYDMDLGDLPQGNGDPKLCIFPEEVTPNGHQLARQFVLLDNTYTSGTNSADGHQWVASAVANGYIERNYSAHSRSYPYDGGDPLAYSPAGFLWTAARRKGLSVRVYGEFVNRPQIRSIGAPKAPTFLNLWQDYRAGGGGFEIRAETDQATLRPLLCPTYIGFPSTVSDQYRADQFLNEFRAFEQNGRFPSLSILLLPNDHTAGTRPGMPTPRAATADGDLALGRIVEAISRSRFWKETLILVMEDDSQMGVDHVDGHRTVAYCASPYTRRGVVVSEPYTHASIVRTIGLVLGFPPLNRFDRSALPLRACFTSQPDLSPFSHRPTNIPLDQMNPPASALRGEPRRLAEACDSLDWTDVDRADAEVVARAVWRSCKPGTPFPTASFHPVEERDDDD